MSGSHLMRNLQDATLDYLAEHGNLAAADELAVRRAGSARFWEAPTDSEHDPIAAYHVKAAEAGLEVMGHVLDVVWDRVVDDDGMVAVVGRLTPQRITTLYEEFVGPMIDVLESWVDGMATSWRENHCSAEDCDEPLDGDSYDGLCGTHTDQAEWEVVMTGGEVIVITTDDALHQHFAQSGPVIRFTAETITEDAWGAARLLLIGDDQSAALAERGLPRRDGTLLVGTDLDDASIWMRAVKIGVEHVVLLPDGEHWLRNRVNSVTI